MKFMDIAEAASQRTIQGLPTEQQHVKNKPFDAISFGLNNNLIAPVSNNPQPGAVTKRDNISQAKRSRPFSVRPKQAVANP